jgi:cytochrome c oxidase subunit I
VLLSVAGGIILLVSAALFIWNLSAFHSSAAESTLAAAEPMRFAIALNPSPHTPALLNGFRTWNFVVLLLMLVAYGYPIAQFFVLHPPQALVHRLDRSS